VKPWRTIASVATADGALELRQRGPLDFLIVIAGRVLMTSAARRSEEDLATLACGAVAARPRPRVLIGGLGMAYTLRAALDALPAAAEVVVAELTREVVDWCRGPMRDLTAGAVDDPRVTIELGDVADVIAGAAPGRFDAIVLDLYEGPHQASQSSRDPFYSAAAIGRSRRALAKGGVFAIWSEEADAPFEQRLRAGGFAVEVHRSGKGGRQHVVYLAR
jgi:spermidine synthase